ncbi:MAG: hypothetical protein KDK05_01710, partial [Candidatus Competibacteraceae bacterium]|nr:hypothetical protein [Candidatus Competibacteraceae bacterium]
LGTRGSLEPVAASAGWGRELFSSTEKSAGARAGGPENEQAASRNALRTPPAVDRRTVRQRSSGILNIMQ